MTSTTYTDVILTGGFDIERLADLPAKLIKLYVCSAGTDTVRERDVLVEKVYPKLRAYCRENYGLEFQVVDLLWGQPGGFDDHNPDRTLLLKEIASCRRLSLGPNFVAMTGQKYGEQQLPQTIPADQMETVMDTLRRHRSRETRNYFQLGQWYVLDENSIPPQYVLQTEASVLSKLQPQTAVEKAIYGERGDIHWEDSKSSLQILLQKATDHSYKDGIYIPDLLASDLDKQIRAAINETNGETKRCFSVQREIEDLKNYVSHPMAPDFMDIKFDTDLNKPVVNLDNVQRLCSLHNTELSSIIPEANTTSFSVLWKNNDGINPKLHKDYLDELCLTFEQTMKEAIDDLVQETVHDHLSPLEKEVYQHWMVVKHHNRTFTGREELLDIIKSYVVSSDTQLLVVHGNSGTGKRAIISKSAVETHKWFEESVSVIVRLIGETTNSFDIRQVLFSICSQLYSLLGITTEVPPGYRELSNLFLQLLANFPDDRNLVIYLDSLHLLVSQYDAHSLIWIPRSLKSNVKMVVSCMPQTYDILERLRMDIVVGDNNFLEIPLMTEDECLSMVMTLLELENRTLTEEQKEVLSTAFTQSQSPLYVKLLLTAAREWTSTTDVSSCTFPEDCYIAINTMLDALEHKHGQVLTRQAIGYLTASSTGMSDCEIEDILSLDDDVIEEIEAQFSISAGACRVPSLAWLRLKNDISDFLLEKECEGVTVSFWNHQMFFEVSKTRYLSDRLKRKQVHSLLGHYHLGTWAGKMKPFKKLPVVNNNGNRSDADRLVPTQPLTFESAATVTLYNKRMYDQVPRHLFLSGRLNELSELVLFRYEWLYNKSKSLSLEQVLADFILNPGVEATLVEQALRDAHPHITQNIDNMAAEISGRLLPYYNTHPNLRKLINECDLVGLSHCAFIPNFPYHQVPGSPLKLTIKARAPPSDLQMVGTAEGNYLLTKERDHHIVQKFDLSTGECKANIFTSVGNIYASPDGTRLAIVDHMTEKTVKIHNTDTGEFVGQLIPLNHIQVKPKEKYKLTDVSVSNSHVCLTVTTDKSYLFIADIDTCKFLQVLGLEGRSTICKITPDAQYVFCSSNDYIMAYDLYSMHNVANTALDHRPKEVIFNSDSSRAFVINGIENKLYMMTLSQGSVDFLYKVLLQDAFHDDIITNLKLSNNEELLLVQGESNLVVYEIASEKVSCHFVRPAEIPLEFKLPGSHYTDIIFTQSAFSPDDKFVIATIFRNVYIWNVSSNRLLTSLQAPVGIIEHLFVPIETGQIVTHSLRSDNIQVWNIGDAIGHVGTLDQLTTSIEDIRFSNNDKTAIIRCKDSDAVGIMDMKTGKLVDLLTHESPVERMSLTPSGKHILVSVQAAKDGIFNKIWHIQERKIVYEFGNAPAYSVALKGTDTIFTFVQESGNFNAPYQTIQYKLVHDTFQEYKLNQVFKFILCQPFVTANDKYLVTLDAESYDESSAQHVNPTICAMSVAGQMNLERYTVSYLQEKIKIQRILHIRPYPNNNYTIACLYTNEPDPKTATPREEAYHHCYGFMIFDICSGVICQVLEEFATPQTPIEDLLFTDDVSLCIDHESNIFDMGTGYFVKRLYNTKASPKCLALDGKVVVYTNDEELFAVRLSDQKCIGNVNVHGKISSVALCHDQRTLVVGCQDGIVLSYILLDEFYDNAKEVLSRVASRKLPTDGKSQPMTSRSWDKIDAINGPAYARPPSAVLSGPTDRDMLKAVKAVTRNRPKTAGSETMRNLSSKSRACVIQ